MKSRNAAVASLLADVRQELVAPPCESKAAEHVAMMRLEEQVLAPAPRPSLGVRARGRVVRATASRPRRFAALFATICVLSGNVGIDAAGALPAAVRRVTDHISDAIVHTFGVPQASDPRAGGQPIRSATPRRSGASASRPSGAREPGAPGSRPSSTGPRPSAAPRGDGQGSTSDPQAVSPGKQSQSPSSPQPPTGTPLPPSTNMQKDPHAYGLPSDWRPRVIAAARAQLEACAQATGPAPVGCPQVAAIEPGAHPASVHWALLNQPLAGATAIAHGGFSRNEALISVYGLFQMEASYTAGDGTQRFAYSGGVAEATMMWDSSAFLYVSFTSGSVADRLPEGVHVPSFERPTNISDDEVLGAVQAGFTAWAWVTGGGGMVVGDPTAASMVAFDPAHGNFTVSGTYALITSGGAAVGNHYTASLVLNDGVVQLLTIADA